MLIFADRGRPLEDRLDEIDRVAHLSLPLVELRAAASAHVESLLRGDVVDGAADGILRVLVEAGEGRELLCELLVWQRTGKSRVLGQLCKTDVARHVSRPPADRRYSQPPPRRSARSF